MARPRVFISSTYFDLKSIREDLDRFISAMGYEAIRHELGHIAYGKDERPEAFAYREIEFCDVLVSIVGGKIGSNAAGSAYSISQQELKKAHEQGKQVFVFVERGVHSEFDLYRNNKDVKGIRYASVNDTKIFEFLEEVYALPTGNPVFSFNTGADITTVLREQLAGLFQRLLNQQTGIKQTSVTLELQRSIQTVGQLVTYLTERVDSGDRAMQEILFANHPIFDHLKDLLSVPYRLYFSSVQELDSWLKGARAFTRITEDLEDLDDHYEWEKYVKRKDGQDVWTLYVKKDLFDSDDALKPMTKARWNTESVRYVMNPSRNEADPMDDDIPF